MSKLNGLYLVALFYEGNGYLLVNKSSKGLMVWNTYMGAVQALVKVEPYLGFLNPEVLFVSEAQHPGVADLYLNDFILKVSNAESVTDIRLKEIQGLGLAYCVPEPNLDDYKIRVADGH